MKSHSESTTQYQQQTPDALKAQKHLDRRGIIVPDYNPETDKTPGQGNLFNPCKHGNPDQEKIF